MRLLVLLLLVPCLAQASEARGTSDLPAPLPEQTSPLLDEYESFITGLSEDDAVALPAAPVTSKGKVTPSPAPRHKGVKVYSGSSKLKLGRSVENGVVVHRGFEPSAKAP